MNHFHFPVSFGTISAIWNPQGQLSKLEWSENRLALWQKVKIPAELVDLFDKIRAYFYHGEPFGEIPWRQIDRSGWSAFQTQVYTAITEIPYGETRTYGWVAARLGKSSACRAVGQALKKNPIPIVIPCHRILSATSIGGFMGVSDPHRAELKLKRRLLNLEEEYRNPMFSFLKAETKYSYGRIGTGC